MTTALFQAVQAASAAYDADDLDLGKLAALEAAEDAYSAAVIAAVTAWDAIPKGDRKDSAETNADDTVIENSAQGDRLYWLQMAVRSYDFA